MTEIPEGRTATALDVDVRRHLSMLLTGTQCGTDDQVVALARMETHRLIGAVVAGLRNHRIDAHGTCTVCCGQFCALRSEMSNSLLPIRRLPMSGG
ncbi:hypothetical protein [Actinokineospora sp.]|uniref:hypothetical protein n=1 Tax=Actinokineospora sp. TaxID=1872133 RepID=UPI003D6B4389